MKSGRRLVIDEYAQIFINYIDKDKSPVLEIGNNVHIGRFSSIGCSHHIVLEDWVRLAPHVHISDRNHKYEDIDTPITLQPINVGKVHIKAHTWLGYGVQVMPGVTIGKHCVIAAGCVVTKDIPDYCVAAGIPAKVVKQYSFAEKRWISPDKALDSAGMQNKNQESKNINV